MSREGSGGGQSESRSPYRLYSLPRASEVGRQCGDRKAEQGRGLNASPRHVMGPSWRRPEAYPAPGSRLRGAGALLEPKPEPQPEVERAGRPGGLEPDVSGASPQTGAAGETGYGRGASRCGGARALGWG